ncbi:MAG: pilus (MSHA type) biogenesis protein MshL [Magnetococcales bacterium]|nr:pilus (MSHA type) biogenesis protein MshL [Magnetococcales bacterium]
MDRHDPMLSKDSPANPRPTAATIARRAGLILLGCLLLAACEPASRIKQSREHFLQPTNPEVEISAAPAQGKKDAPLAALAESASPEEVYTITVTEMPVKDLLFALARDANKNIDVYPGIQGRVTLSAIDQPLSKILDRVARQVAIRYEIQDKTIVVTPDLPYLKIYQVDYLGIEREMLSTNKISNNLTTTKGNALTNPMSGTDNNQSNSTLNTKANSSFWKTITQNIQAILGADVGIEFLNNQDQQGGQPSGSGGGQPGGGSGMPTGINAGGLPPGGGMTAQPMPQGLPGLAKKDNQNQSMKPGLVSVNTEAGVMSIVATSQQHERIQEYLDSVLENVHRQVLIESTVVEVELSDRFQEGVDWNVIFNRSAGVVLKSAFTDAATAAAGSAVNYFTLGHTGGPNGNPTTDAGPVNATIKLLENFGNAKILSSPKIMALNNQPAVLKVVKNKVFFTLKSSTASRDVSSSNNSNSTGTVATQPVFDTEIHTVPVGLVMTVTPQISKEGIVSLNVRPTISRISRWVNDPNPALVKNNAQTNLPDNISNPIPEIEVKEMETMMRVHSGQVAVMGGLMQDSISNATEGLPTLSRLPMGIGTLFGHKDEGVSKSELVIFLRPVVMTHGRPRETVAERSREMMRDQPQPQGVQSQSAPAAKPAPVDSGDGKDKGDKQANQTGDKKKAVAAKPSVTGETINASTKSASTDAGASGSAPAKVDAKPEAPKAAVQTAPATTAAAPATPVQSSTSAQAQTPAPVAQPAAPAPAAPAPVAQAPAAPAPVAQAPAVPEASRAKSGSQEATAAQPKGGASTNALAVGNSYLDFTNAPGQNGGAAAGGFPMFPSAPPSNRAFPVRDADAPTGQAGQAPGPEAALDARTESRL